MPYVFDFEFAHRVLLCTFSGDISDAEIRQFHRDAARVVQRVNPRVGIVDLTGVTVFDISGSTIQELANATPPMPDITQPRFIVAPSDHVYGLSRMYQIIGEATRPRLQVVRSMQEALSAIDLQEPSFQKIPDE